jgi:hypothetical protein
MTQPMDDSMIVAIRSRPEASANDAVRAEPVQSSPEPLEAGGEQGLSRSEERAGAPAAIDAASTVAPLGGLYAAPFGFVLRATVNRARRCVPVVIDDPDQLDAIARALELVAGDGGFEAHASSTCRVEARIRLSGTHASAASSIRALSGELLDLASDALPEHLMLRDPLALELPPVADDALLVCLGLTASGDAHLENALYGAACAIAPALSRLAGVTPNVRVTRKPIDHFHVRCRIGVERLIDAALEAAGPIQGEQLEDGAVERAVAAIAAGERQRVVAAAHNGLVASGVAAVALALGNAPARVVADAERHAARNGDCRPLCTWRAVGDDVEGELELPLRITTHGRWLTSGEAAEAGGAPPNPALDIGMLSACVGMAASLVALMDAVRLRVQGDPERISRECEARRDRSETEPPSVASL